MSYSQTKIKGPKRRYRRLPTATPRRATTTDDSAGGLTRQALRDQRPASNLQETSARQLLRTIMQIDSPTRDVAGVDRVQDILAARFRALGFEVTFHENGSAASGRLLVATLPGEESSYITFVSHADTVLSHAEFGQAFVVDETAGTATGSGVIDNKGGVVVLVEGLTRYLTRRQRKKNKPRWSLRVVISPNEEAGSVGFNESFRAYAVDSSYVLGFEPALDDGSIIKSRRGNRWYDIQITGREAHAGRSKGEHVNAAHELAFKIVKFHKLSKPHKGVAVNVGAVSAGRDKFNVICGQASCKLDVRFTDFEARDRLHRKIEKILNSNKVYSMIGGHSCDVTYTLADDCPPFASNARSRRAVKLYLKAIENVEGLRHHAAIAGGAGDVNYMSGPKVVIIDGLGPIGGGMHTDREFLDLESLETRAESLAQFLVLI